MLTKEQLDDYCKLLGLSESSAGWIKKMRADAPARAAQGRRRNVTSRYPSRKMGCTIQSESRTNELANIILLENDPSVLEFWDQPGEIKLSYKLESGESLTILTADYPGPVCPGECRLWLDRVQKGRGFGCIGKEVSGTLRTDAGWHLALSSGRKAAG